MSEDIITQMQTKISYQEQAIHELGSTVMHMQKQIDQLEIVCRDLKERLREASSMLSGISDQDEKPPHY